MICDLVGSTAPVGPDSIRRTMPRGGDSMPITPPAARYQRETMDGLPRRVSGATAILALLFRLSQSRTKMMPERKPCGRRLSISLPLFARLETAGPRNRFAVFAIGIADRSWW